MSSLQLNMAMSSKRCFIVLSFFSFLLFFRQWCKFIYHYSDKVPLLLKSLKFFSHRTADYINWNAIYDFPFQRKMGSPWLVRTYIIFALILKNIGKGDYDITFTFVWNWISMMSFKKSQAGFRVFVLSFKNLSNPLNNAVYFVLTYCRGVLERLYNSVFLQCITNYSFHFENTCFHWTQFHQNHY